MSKKWNSNDKTKITKCRKCPDKVKHLYVKNIDKKDAAKKSGHRQRQQGSPADAESRTKNPRSDFFGRSLSESICRSKHQLPCLTLYVYDFKISEFYSTRCFHQDMKCQMYYWIMNFQGFQQMLKKWLIKIRKR